MLGMGKDSCPAPLEVHSIKAQEVPEEHNWKKGLISISRSVVSWKRLEINIICHCEARDPHVSAVCALVLWWHSLFSGAAWIPSCLFSSAVLPPLPVLLLPHFHLNC